MAVQRARNYFVTLQAGLKDGTKEEEEEWLKSWFKNWKISDSARYAVGQLERGDGGRLHVQLCGVLHNAAVTKASNLVRIGAKFGLPKHAHIEVMRATLKEAKAYCTKEKGREVQTNPKELGEEPVGGGTRSDLIDFVSRLGGSDLPWDEVDEREPFLSSRHHALIRRLYVKKMQSLYRTVAPKCIWLWGPSGSGKSWDSFHKYSKPEWQATGEAYLKSHNGKGAGWWDGFDPMICKTVILNEFRGGIEFSLLMQIADEYPMRVSIRGEQDRPLKFDTLVVNSIMHPKDVYKGVFEGDGGEEPYEQLERRFTIIKKTPRQEGPMDGYVDSF